MSAADVWLLVLAREPADAKRRLANVLDARARAELAVAMLADVLAAAREVPFARRVVVTESETVRAVAREAGADTLDVPLSDTSGAAAAAFRHAHDGGAARALVLAADLPLLRPEDLEELAGDGARVDVVIAPDRHGRGTNALLVAPPLLIAPAFGDDSLRRHREHARRARARLRVVTSRGVVTDVDDADDLRYVRSAEDLGPRTRAALDPRAAAARA